MLALLYFIYLMTSTGWSTVPHGSLRDIPLVFDSVAAFIIFSAIFSIGINITYVSLAVFAVSMFTCLYAIGQRFCFDPLFKQRLGSIKEDIKRKLYESNKQKAEKEHNAFVKDNRGFFPLYS